MTSIFLVVLWQIFYLSAWGGGVLGDYIRDIIAIAGQTGGNGVLIGSAIDEFDGVFLNNGAQSVIASGSGATRIRLGFDASHVVLTGNATSSAPMLSSRALPWRIGVMMRAASSKYRQKIYKLNNFDYLDMFCQRWYAIRKKILPALLSFVTLY